MKFIIAIAIVFSLQAAWAIPVSNDETKCSDVFSDEMCDDYENMISSVDDDRFKRQLGGVDPLEALVAEKLKFLAGTGMFRRIPILGDAIHQLVENDPQGVARALKDHFFGALRLATMILATVG